MTKEHVLPNWLRAIFPRLPTDTHTFGSINMVNIPTAGPVPLPTRKQGQGQAGSKKVKVVCKACNIGWLSAMEEATKPILERLVYGMPGTLTVAEQRLLATWVAKTIMVAEFLEPKQIAISQSEREDFRLKREPGKHWQIWAAFYTGEKWMMGGIFHHGVGLHRPPVPARARLNNTQYSVVGLGRLLAICLSSEADWLTFGLHKEFEVAVHRLWPPTGRDAAWPPQWSIDDVAINKVIGAFGQLLGTPMPPL